MFVISLCKVRPLPSCAQAHTWKQCLAGLRRLQAIHHPMAISITPSFNLDLAEFVYFVMIFQSSVNCSIRANIIKRKPI